MKDCRDCMKPRQQPHKPWERGWHDHDTQEVGCQHDAKRDNVVCTCKNGRIRRPEVGYYGSPKQIYAYHGVRSYTDIGVGSVKTLMRKKVKKIYLPETDDRGVGSSELTSVIMRRTKQRENSYYDHKRTSSKCVGGIIEYNTGCVLSKKLSPIIQTRSGTTSPIEPSLNKNQEIGSNTVINSVNTKTSKQVDTEVNDKWTVHNSVIKDTIHKASIQADLKLAKKSKDKKPKLVNTTKSIESKTKEAEKVYSSDSLEQHVHDLEVPSEEEPSHTSVDPMENKLEREYRRIFSTRSKDEKAIKEDKSKSSRTNSDIKSPSVLRRRFEALRRGLAKKEDLKRSATLMIKASSQISAASHKDVSIASDPPSLESRSYSNTKTFSPLTSIVGHDRIYDKRAACRDSISSGKEKTDGEDSESQGVKGMFKLWGKKFNLEEDYNLEQPSPEPSISISKKSINKTEAPKPPKDADVKKEGRKFFFFKKKSKDKTKPYKAKKGVTTGRCEVRDGLMIKIGGVNQPDIINESIPEGVEDYDEIMRKAWLRKYLTQTIESRNSVKIRWNNKTFATSSSTVFELMDNVYKEAGVMLKSKSEITIAESYYKSFTRQQVNFVYQNIEAWMLPQTIPDRPKDLPVQINFKSSEEAKDDIEIRISDQKWFIDKSKAFSHKIEVVLHTKNFVQKKQSSEYLRIDIPKGFFIDSSSDDKRNQSSDEQVFNVVEYETGSEIKRNMTARSTGDNKYNNIEVTVNVKTSKDIEPEVLETVIKTPAMHRDVVIQGSNVYIPNRCDVIGVGIITQRDLREIRKPILKIRDDVSDEESEHRMKSNHKKSRFAESYLQDYYRQWTPLGMDFYSWCVSDSHLRCCSDYSKSTFNNQVEGTRSCPNILDDFQPATVVSSCDTSSCSHFVAYVDEEKPNDKFSTKFFAKLKNNKKDKKEDDCTTRILPKDSIEVFKRRKIYALSNKSRWACADDEPYSVPSNESRGAQNNINDCNPKVVKPCCKTPDAKPKKTPCNKHVSIPDCEGKNMSPVKELGDGIPGILTFKGSAGCDACKDTGRKNAIINSDCVTEIPQVPCKTSCEKIKEPPCTKFLASNLPKKRSPLGGQPCDPLCPLNKTPSPRCTPTKKPSPLVKRSCSPPERLSPVMKRSSPPAKKSCMPLCPSADKPAAKKSCLPNTIPCPPKCGSVDKPPHHIGDTSTPSGIKLSTPGRPSPTGSGSNPCDTGPSPPRSPGKPSPIGSGCSPCKTGSPNKLSPTGSGAGQCKSKTSPMGLPSKPRPTRPGFSSCNAGSPGKMSPTRFGSSPCKTGSNPACKAPCSPKRRASPIRKCDRSPPKSGKTSPCGNSSSAHRKRPCLRKQVSPLANPCPPGKPSTPLKTPQECCSPQCKGIKPELCPNKSLDQKPSPTKLPQLPQSTPAGETWCPLCKTASGSVPKLPGPQEVTPGNTSNSSNSNTPKKTGVICLPCAKLFEKLKKKSSSKSKNKTPPGTLPSNECLPAVERRKSCGPCQGCKSDDNEFPWPLKNQVSNQSLLPKCLSAPNGNVRNCEEKSPYSPKVSAHSMIRIEGLRSCDKKTSRTCHGPPCVITQVPPCIPTPKQNKSPTQIPLPNKSKSKLSGIWLKMKPSKKKSSKDTAMKCQDYGCIRLSSKENLTIRMKAETPSTEEIREIKQGINMKVQDDDGQTLYERRDYRGNCPGSQHRPSVLGDMYRTSNVIHSLHRISTQVIGEAITSNKQDNNVEDKSDASLSNMIEIQFQMKVTQGDKTTEIGIVNDDNEKCGKKSFKQPEEVFVVKDDSVHSIESKDAKNDINIRIVIKNFKSKSDKKKSKCYHDEFSREISDKFHTVSTGYSDNLCDANADNVFSVHRATVDLTTSGNKSRTEDPQNCDGRTYTEVKPINVLKSVHSTKLKERIDDSKNDATSEIDKHYSDKDVTKEVCRKISQKENLNVKADPTEIDLLKKYTENYITDNTDTERSELQKPSDFTKRNYLSDKYDYTDIDTEKDDFTEREDLTERDLTEKDDLTDRNNLTEREDFTEKDDLTDKDYLTEKEDLNETDDDAKKFEEKTSSHKIPKVQYVDIQKRRSFQQNYEAPISTDTDEHDLILEANTSTDNDTAGSIEVIIKPHTRDEKKEMLKDVFEKAHATNVKSKTRMRKLRDMLKSILTSDSSGHDDLKINELAKDLTYASLKPNYFRDTDSMTNYYKCDQVSDKVSVTRPVVYPTEEKNSECSKSSDVYSSEEELPHKECMCSTLATRLNLCQTTGGGCCCRKSVKKDEEIVCDIKSEDSKANLVDVQTQYSKYFYSNTSTNGYAKSSIIETCNMVKIDEIPGTSDGRKERKPLKRSFSPYINQMKECPMKKFNRNTILTISDDDKIVLHRNRAKIEGSRSGDVDKTPMAGTSDILQSYEAKKAVLEIYAEKTMSVNGDHFVAKLPKFVYDRENEILMNYEAIAANNYTAVNRNVIMMSIKR